MSTWRMIPEAEREQYIADWSQPGALTRDAQLVPRLASSSSRRPGSPCRCPTGCCGAFPTIARSDARRSGACATARCCRSARRSGSAGRRPDCRTAARGGPFRAMGSAASRSPRRFGASSPEPARLSAGGMTTPARSRSRSAARLAAVQALYQQEMEGTPIARLLKRIPRPSARRDHRGRAHIVEAERELLRRYRRRASTRAAARSTRLISGRLAEGWSLDRLDRPMRAILRAGTYELIARPDVPVGSVISEYVDVAHAFYDKRESGFVNGLLDAIAKEARRRARGARWMRSPGDRSACGGLRPIPPLSALPTMRRCSTAWS